MTHWHKYFTLLIVLCMGFAGSALAQDGNLIRYVRTTGAYSNDGTSWGTAKKNVQDAINDLRDYMQRMGIKEGGRVYVAEGTYLPTESTEEMDGGVLYTAFKLYAGISVYGGFSQEAPEATPDERAMIDGTTHPWEFAHKTILSGNHNLSKDVSFTWNDVTKRFKTVFPANSYHVVWFATNGFTGDRANALAGKAVLDGCTIEGGDAKERNIDYRHHASYGGGAYMVDGAVLSNCEVRMNEATLRGGGVYMDGGGEITECHIHTNQVLGIGIIQGYGGGVCIDDKGLVKHSILQNNVARMGGGLALTEENAVAEADYLDIAAAGCVVANNTANAEAGGVLMLQGGMMNHMTIVRNACTGPDVIIDGRRMGRSAGLYMTKSGFVTNSVIWGNQGAASNNMQFAAYTVTTESLQPTVSYTAVGNGDVTDWSGVLKQSVMSIENGANTGTNNKYPDFLDKSLISTEGINAVPYGAGLDEQNIEATLDRWHPAGTSPLREAGVQITNYDSYDKNKLTYLTEDMMGKEFMQLTTLGAYTPEVVMYAPAMLPSEEKTEGNILTFFVDPAAKEKDRTNFENLGSSWEAAMGFVNDVAHWYENNLGKTIHYVDGGVGKEMTLESNTPIQVFVKEGEIYPIGYSKTANMRSSYIKLVNNLRLYGSVPKTNTLTDVSGRDVKNHLTTLTGNITNNGYANNACHIIAYSGASNTIVDGFRIAYANAQASTLFNPVNKNGAGFVIDSKVTGSGNVLNNKVRNCIIANNTAIQGAALYIRSEQPETEVDIEFINCLFHNNTSVDGTLKSAVHIESGAEGSAVNVRFNHCNFLKNVGYGLYVKGQNTHVTLNNCFVWANASQKFENSALLAEGDNSSLVRPIAVEDGATLSGTNNILDAGANQYGLSNSKSILTYENTSDGSYTYPISVNPTKNIGHSERGDLTYYGGAVDYTPRNMSPLVNAASNDSEATLDFIGNSRNYGGLPDVGALENTSLPASGKVLYVRDYRTANGDIDLTRGGDGLSWATAINGNAVYQLAEGDAVAGTMLPKATLNSAGERYEADASYKDSFNPYNFNDGSANVNNKSDDVTIRGFKTNNYRHTSGLQYAVNLARLMMIQNAHADAEKRYVEMGGPGAKSNRLVIEDRHKVQVWIVKGVYNDGKGFKMQDGVDVMAGFPEVLNANPGLTERNPVTNPTKIQVLAPNCDVNAINADTYKNILQPYANFYHNPNQAINIQSEDWEAISEVPNELSSYGQENIKVYNFSAELSAGDAKVTLQDETNSGKVHIVGVRLIQNGQVVASNFAEKVATTPQVVTSIANISADKEYVMSTARGGWAVKDDKFKSTSDAGFGTNIHPLNDHIIFQLKNGEGSTFSLYSIYAKKYVKKDASLSETVPEDKITWSDDKGESTFVGKFDDSHYVNLGGSNQMAINGWSTADAGNKVTIMDVTDLRETAYILNAPTAGNYMIQVIVETKSASIKGITTKVLAVGSNQNDVAKKQIIGSNKNSYDWYRVLTQPRNINGSPNEGGYGGFGVVNNGTDYNGADYYNKEVVDYSIDGLHGVNKLNDWSVPTNERALNDSTTFRHKTTWNGFIIQGGYMGTGAAHEGGGGAVVRYNGKLENCIIQYNMGNSQYGGGVLVRKGEIINTAIRYNYGPGYGGGVSATKFAILYNCEIYDNDANSDGSQIFLNQSLFYNNTITVTGDDKHYVSEKNLISFLQPQWFQYSVMVNNIISAVDADDKKYPLFKMSFTDLAKNNIVFAYNNYYEGKAAADYDASFLEGLTSNFNLVEAPQFKDQLAADFHLSSSSPCRNVAYEISTYSYQGKDYPVDFPTFDKDYTERVKDCRLDLGAHEYNGAYEISPTVGDLPPIVDSDDANISTSNSGNTVDGEYALSQKFNGTHTMSAVDAAIATPTMAVYYVTMTGAGLASGQNPENAACREKLQKVLDAAGRYKYLHPDEKVIVKLATIKSGDNYYGYAPSRSTVNNAADLDQSNPRTYSLMVPRGVEVWGGYDDNFVESARSVINNKTILTGGYTSDGLNVNCYHVVTFTDHLFDAEGRLITDENLPTGDDWAGITATPSLADKADAMGNYNRAVLDGLFIEEGDASGEDRTGEASKEFRYGGAAIVTNFAHVRNCVLTNNTASIGGGALYMEEGGLVSGCVFERNKAENGGAIYVKESVADAYAASAMDADSGIPYNDVTTDAYISNFAHLYSCTIVDNEATDAGGGVWFSNNLRAVNVVLWQNQGNNGTNVSGLTDPFITTEASQNAWDYPFSYCAIENILVPGVSNIAVSTEPEKGVRFDDADAYYPLKRHSVLARAGYAAPLYVNRQGLFPTLETVDMAGNSRISYNRDQAGNLIPGQAKDKDYMEIGARAYNGPLEVIPEANNLMTRIYVVKSEDIDHEIYDVMAHADDGKGNLLYLEGSSFAYPMQRLDDALQYIRKARDLKGKNNETFENVKFEIFMSKGTYTPVRNIQGNTGALRNNTFLVPEGVSIYGGFVPKNADNAYYGPAGDNSEIEGIQLDGSATEGVIAARERADLNQNSVLEPWEMKNQTILSGKCLNSDRAENVFHVITCMADQSLVGALPTAEEPLPIVLSGLQITGGSALHGEADEVGNVQSFYKGGGVMVDGSWGVAVKRQIILVVHECDFTNNRAGDGGAIYSNGVVEVYASSFEQNAAKYCAHSESADESGDAEHGRGHGGAIFSDYSLTVVNSIFANNEAGAIENADDRENDEELSRGGAIYHNGTRGLVMLNSNVVRNQAVSYPALYVNTPNAGGDVAEDNPHKIINTIFWGNELRADALKQATNGEQALDFVVNFHRVNDGTQVTDPRDFAPWIVQSVPTVAEMLWNCAYEEGRGCSATSEPAFRGLEYDYHMSIPAIFAASIGEDKRKWMNNNVILNANNEALDGPNFVTPTSRAGVANYMPSADWTISRRNSLVDNGWTKVALSAAAGTNTFAGTGNDHATGVYAEVRELVQDPNTYNYSFKAYPLFDEVYMIYDKQEMGDDNKMYRVAIDPNENVSETYIDIGAYEFRHTKLKPQSDDKQLKDILWVAEQSKGEADGSTFDNATTDLQRAIETLLSSRNNYDKEIRLIKGSYAPMYTIDHHLSFTVNTQAQNNVAIFPEDENNYAELGVKSLMFVGGWSDEYEADAADAETYPALLHMEQAPGKDASIFRIVDARNWYHAGDDARPYPGEQTELQQVVPIVFDGLTFVNPYAMETTEGAAINYLAQYNYDEQAGQNSEVLVQSTLLDKPKLTIGHSKFVLNGAAKDADENVINVPAVKIGAGGGYALVYNSVFHSNRGDALQGDNTRVVNNTFALNGGGVVLSATQTVGANDVDIKSRIHNSLFWGNGGTITVGAGDAGKDLFTFNSYVTNALSDDESEKDNDMLSPDNNDLINGPNFKAPNVGATSEADILARDFSLMPSAKTINRGSNSLYLKWVHNNDKADATIADLDAAYAKRLFGENVDRGAYEYQNALLRYIYVDPEYSSSGDGKSWENSYNSLQEAVDLVAVSAIISPDKPGYVFCKGGLLDETVTMRPNVRVYGSIAPSYLKEAASEETDALDTYVDLLLGERYGVTSGTGSPTTVRGIYTTGDYTTGDYDAMPSLLDGFIVTPRQGEAVTAPVVDLKGKGAMVRNVVVHGVQNTSDSDVPGEQSAVRINGGVLYNALVRDCSQPAAYVGSNGRAVHCTFVGAEGDGNAVEGDGKVYNSIIYGNVPQTGTFIDCHHATVTDVYPFATYLNATVTNDNHPAKPVRFSSNKNLWYQLEETSLDLDACTLSDDYMDDLKSVLGIADDVVLASFIDVATDRDLLGNPRLLNAKLDRGCYETWNAVEGGVLEATYGEGGMRFPQEGSVVYVQKDASLVLNADDFALSGTGRGSRLVVRPGYLLLKNGASFYGGGAGVALPHVSVERTIGNGNENFGALVALPYEFKYADVRRVEYDDATRRVSQQTADDAAWYYYDGAARSAFDYTASLDDSKCWQPVGADEVLARNAGRYFMPAESGVYRFTAAATDADEAVYTEGYAGTQIENSKTVVLTQYDNRNFAPNFTTAENMGWNLVGAPYLVANYAAGLKEDENGFSPDDYNMSLPRMIYTLTADTPDAGDFQSGSSVSAQGLSPAAAFFTQTAVKSGETEQLVFQMPVYVEPVAPVSKRMLVLTDEDGHTDEVEINPATDGTAGSMVYTYGRDAVKWMAMNDALPQAYVLNDTVAGTRFSILGEAPVATEILLGVKAGANGRLTFALSATEAYETFTNVWLTDRVTGVVTNLKQDSYTAEMEAGTETASRFTVKFGGNRPEMKDDLTAKRYEVSGKNGVLHINGLMGGETITVYDASGRLMHKAMTSQQRHSVALSTGVYVVRIDNEVHKVTVE